jgi:hypothetical protein
MREQLNTTLGFYRPTFFKLQVNRSENLENINILSDITSAIYLHEYVHFLQDISTTYGFINISTVVDYIKHINQITQNGQSRIFSVPFNPRPTPNDEVYFNLNLKKKYIGSIEDVVTANVVSITKLATPVTLKNGNVNVDTVVIDYDDASGNRKYHQFGSHCIIESMAYLIENALYPNLIPNTLDFPYRSAEKVISKEYNSLLVDSLNIIALCDVSLMSFNPGDFFYSMLLQMKSEGFIPSQPEDIYSFCSSRVSFNYHGSTTLNQLLLSTGNIASCQLCDYFTTPIFGDNKTWINYTISTAIDIRQNDPYFILKIARNGKIQTNLSLINVFKKVGTPMVTNLDDEATFYSPLQTSHKIFPEYLWAISQVYGLYIKSLANNQKKCELKLWCKESCSIKGLTDFTDDNCYNSPWQRTSYNNLCPFAVIWKTWGMENEIPQ